MSSVATAENCPNEAIRAEQGSTMLPDCRAYEQVTPPSKDSSALWSPSVVSPNGSALVLRSLATFAGAEANVGVAPPPIYSMRRTESGWVTVPLEPPASEYIPYLQKGLASDYTQQTSEDGLASLFIDEGITRPGYPIDLYLRRADGSIADVGPITPPNSQVNLARSSSGEGMEIEAVGMSDDASHVLFQYSGAEAWPFPEAGGPLYEYLGTGNTEPLLVGVGDDGREISQCGTELGADKAALGQENDGLESTHDAVSADGNTVFFTAIGCAPPTPGPPVNELFARIDNGLAGAHTVAISEPSKQDCSVCDTESSVLAGARFEGASEDGSRVLFTTGQPLLDGASGLYEYNFNAPEGEKVRFVAPGARVIEVSEDGSHVYFRSSNALGVPANSEGQYAQPGAGNVYVYDSETSQISFVTDGEVGVTSITPDGRFMVFTSRSDLTPDDTSTAQQVFEYDAQTGVLTRVSIGQAGFNDNGNAPCCVDDARLVANHSGYGSRNVDYKPSAYPTYRWVSADGQYVFFESSDGLTPQALDNKVIDYSGSSPEYAMNIYEYHDGVVSLISDGRDISVNKNQESNVELIGTDASGGDVFFTTADQLVGQDTDSNADVYDARINGGFPGPVVPPSCSGDACQGPLSAAPTLLTAGSELQAGSAPLQSAPAPTATKPKPKAKVKQKTRKRPKTKQRGKRPKAKKTVVRAVAKRRGKR
ncbi:MAG TPA: hypothetical protein VK730_02245 [Solirubrobacteraceae bacterium]|nr:hypothetical protein [Solirubrobacteraceae bacterium]